MSTSAKSAPAKPAKATSTPVKSDAVAAKAAPAKKVAIKPAAKPVANAPKVAEKPAKIKKAKMVRDSFTMPKAEFAILDVLKSRAADLKVPTKKTELIRAGIKALAAMNDTAFLAAIAAVPSLKTGRPAKS
jgi:hypothetical protein